MVIFEVSPSIHVCDVRRCGISPQWGVNRRHKPRRDVCVLNAIFHAEFTNGDRLLDVLVGNELLHKVDVFDKVRTEVPGLIVVE